jgi:hypothetical protein
VKVKPDSKHEHLSFAQFNDRDLGNYSQLLCATGLLMILRPKVSTVMKIQIVVLLGIRTTRILRGTSVPDPCLKTMLKLLYHRTLFFLLHHTSHPLN